MIEIMMNKKFVHVYGEHKTQVAYQWCVDNLGVPEPTGDRWAWNRGRTFWFHKQEDATLFALVWS